MKEEGHYTLQRVKKLPKKGNSNLLYAIKTEDSADDQITELYRWLLNGTYQKISVGGDATITVQTIENALGYTPADEADAQLYLEKESNIQGFWRGTQAAYDGLTPDANTIYFIEE